VMATNRGSVTVWNFNNGSILRRWEAMLGQAGCHGECSCHEKLKQTYNTGPGQHVVSGVC
jgi:hypothetical protein